MSSKIASISFIVAIILQKLVKFRPGHHLPQVVSLVSLGQDPFKQVPNGLQRHSQPADWIEHQAIAHSSEFFPVKKREDIPIVTADLERVLSGKLVLS